MMVVCCGSREKFGLYYVNYSDPTRPRVAKDSSHVMAEIIRTRQLPPQKYVEEGDLEADLQRSGLETSIDSERQNKQQGQVELNNQETAEELEAAKGIPSVVGINVN
jgi:hypothetical protein